MIIEDLNLYKNPFSEITPNINFNRKEKLHWADMSKLKKRLDDIYERDVSAFNRQVILNWGALGGGKTFAAQYYLFNFQKDNIYNIYVKNPKDGSKANEELYNEIISFLTYPKIKEQIALCMKKMGKEQFRNFINGKIRSNEFTDAIIWIGDNNHYSDDVKARYIFGNITSTELRKIKLVRALTADSDYIKFLTGILICFIGDGEKINGRIVIWLDEMEDLIYFTGNHYRRYSQLLRDLVDNLSNGFTLFMNFTLSENEVDTIQLLMGEALWSRIDRKIRFELIQEDKIIYVSELLNFNSIDTNAKSCINNEAIEAVLQTLPESVTTPREINKRFRSIINYALDMKKKEINADFAYEWIEKVLKYEM